MYKSTLANVSRISGSIFSAAESISPSCCPIAWTGALNSTSLQYILLFFLSCSTQLFCVGMQSLRPFMPSTIICIKDGTGQDFLDPTRPVNFKIIAG